MTENLTVRESIVLDSILYISMKDKENLQKFFGKRKGDNEFMLSMLANDMETIASIRKKLGLNPVS